MDDVKLMRARAAVRKTCGTVIRADGLKSRVKSCPNDTWHVLVLCKGGLPALTCSNTVGMCWLTLNSLAATRPAAPPPITACTCRAQSLDA